MKKLFKVKLTTTTYVMAENKEAAIQIAKEHVWDDVRAGGSIPVSARKVTNLEGIPRDWLIAVPWGGDQATIKQIVVESTA